MKPRINSIIAAVSLASACLFMPAATAFWEVRISMEQLRERLHTDQVVQISFRTGGETYVMLGAETVTVTGNVLTVLEQICQKGTMFGTSTTTSSPFYCSAK